MEFHGLTSAGAETAALLPGPAVITPPLHIVAPLPQHAPSRSLSRSPRLTWLFDGAGWPWLRAAADLLALLAAVGATSRLHPGDASRMLPLVPMVLGLFCVRGLYGRRISPQLVNGTMSAASSLAIATMTLAVGNMYLTGHALGELPALHLWIISVFSVVGLRAILLGIRHLLRATRIVSVPTLILGAGVVGDRIGRRLVHRRGYGLDPIGFLDPGEDVDDDVLERTSELPILGVPDDLKRVVDRTGATHVIISFSRERDRDLIPLIRRCTALGLDISLVPRLFESINDRLTRESVGPMPLHVMRATNPRGWQFVCKHVFDRTVAALALVMLAPVLALLALAVKLTSAGPVLFRQMRIGRDGQVFEMLKFRSMRMAAPDSWDGPDLGLAPGGIEGIDRRTALGPFLRRSSLDELPQLWNVLRGEMSLVGPRPERPEFVARFGTEFDRYDDRHRVKSGITGWAQVNGLRGKTELKDRIAWDNYYIENWALALDFKILARTAVAVLRSAE
ncbi:MAG TPA: sugar transferase [Solirubrobacteraceae bacterium]|nr:sugar transferase [Solirubrobacteraceae bacterium]